MRCLAVLCACLSLTLIGCQGEPAPSWPLLPTGTDAVTFNEPSRLGDEANDPRIVGHISLYVGEGNSGLGLEREILESGVKIRVIEDTPGTENEKRPVQVRVLEGKYADRIGTIQRQFLRTIPR